jgi:hypothetical protein
MMTATNYFTRYRHIAPLAVFRIMFGAVLFISTCRFIAKGWVRDFYIKPAFHFPFIGFEWIHPHGAVFMYTLYALMALSALLVCLGLYYRIATCLFFLCFCYAELLDKTYYLNHYYLVTIFSFLLILVPANRYFSFDVLRRPSLRATRVPAWTILMLKYQLCIIYCCAGLSKLTSDWLLLAMPLRIWLPAKASIPLIGPLLNHVWVAYFFSWASALFDLSIAFILLNNSSRRFGYFLVIIFHVLTAILFQIGMFPWLMMSATLIFFSENFHIRVINILRKIFSIPSPSQHEERLPEFRPTIQRLMPGFLACYFLFQVLFPFRFLLYPGNLLWTEEGYRFSWRVMLMEKGGTSFFFVKNGATGRKFEVNNSDFLTPYQERMMETQPDMILQYAHMLKEFYQRQGIDSPEVTVQCYVALNGRRSRLFIDSSVNLAAEKETWFGHKPWILPFTNN